MALDVCGKKEAFPHSLVVPKNNGLGPTKAIKLKSGTMNSEGVSYVLVFLIYIGAGRGTLVPASLCMIMWQFVAWEKWRSSHCRWRLPAVVPIKAPKVFQFHHLSVTVSEADIDGRFIWKDIQWRQQGRTDGRERCRGLPPVPPNGATRHASYI